MGKINQTKMNEVINDYELLGVCSEKTNNIICIDSYYNQSHYKQLIQSKENELKESDNSCKCYTCNGNIKHKYFANKVLKSYDFLVCIIFSTQIVVPQLPQL